MTTKKKILNLIIIFLISITSFAGSANAEMEKGLFPEEKEEKVGDVKLESKEYPLLNYGMDTDPDESFWDFVKISDNTNEALMILNSFLWNMNKIFFNFISWILTESFALDIIDKIAGIVGTVIQTIAGVSSSGLTGKGLWPLFLPLLVLFLGIWVIYRGVILRQASVTFGGILSSVMVCALSLGFYMNAEKIITNVNGFVTQAQNEILSFSLSKTSTASYSEGEGIAAMKNQLFNTMIKYPWLLMQFGTLDEAKIESEWKKEGSRIDTLLKTKPFTEERQEAVKYEVKDLKNESMATSSLINRLGILLVVMALNGFLGTILALITGSLIYFSFKAISGMVVTPITFLAGMIPSMQSTALKTLSKIAYAFYMKIGLTVLAVVFFTISSAIYANTDPKNGLFALFITQIILSVVIWKNRYSLLNIVNKPFKAVAPKDGVAPGLAIKDYKEKIFQIKSKAQPIINKFSIPKNNRPNVQANNPKSKPNLNNMPKVMPAKNADQKTGAIKPGTTQPQERRDKNTAAPAATLAAKTNQGKALEPKPIAYTKSENTRSANKNKNSIKQPEQLQKPQAVPAANKKYTTPTPQAKNIKLANDKHSVKQPMKTKQIKPVKLQINDWREKE